jgi:hypothetical protein
VNGLPMPFAATCSKSINSAISARGLGRLGWAEICQERVAFMNGTSIFIGLLIVLFTILLLHGMRKAKAQVARSGSQRMCPHCGLITSRLKARCLECGKPFTKVEYSISKK